MSEPSKTTSITIPMSVYDFICERSAKKQRSRNWVMTQMLMYAMESIKEQQEKQ